VSPVTRFWDYGMIRWRPPATTPDTPGHNFLFVWRTHVLFLTSELTRDSSVTDTVASQTAQRITHCQVSRGGTVDAALVSSSRFPPPHNQSSFKTNLRRDRCCANGFAYHRAIGTLFLGPDGRRELQPDGIAQQISAVRTSNATVIVVRLRRRRYLQDMSRRYFQ